MSEDLKSNGVSAGADSPPSPVSRLGRTPEIHDRRYLLLKHLENEKYETCMDLGGTDSSHHSGDLTRMKKMGLVERKRFVVGISGGHWRYRRSQAGREYLLANDQGYRSQPGADAATKKDSE